MKICKIITKRNLKSYSSWDLVYEWEDELSRELRCGYFYEKGYFKGRGKLEKLIGYFPILRFLLQTTRNAFMFEMSDWRENDKNNEKNIVPCIIDSYPNNYPIDIFRQQYGKHNIVFLSSRQTFDYYKKQTLPFKIAHLPLSISSCYRITKETTFDKKYDAAIIGRPNPILKSFLLKYAEIHPNFVYVYHNNIAYDHSYYTSDGECLGVLDTRAKYIDLLKKVKIGLYSTSGMDNDKLTTQKKSMNTSIFHQVTPRFLEMVACGCHIVARYDKNPDTDFFELEKFSDNIDTYQKFEERIDSIINKTPDMKLYSEYLEKHYTKERAKELTRILNLIL